MIFFGLDLMGNTYFSDHQILYLYMESHEVDYLTFLDYYLLSYNNFGSPIALNLMIYFCLFICGPFFLTKKQYLVIGLFSLPYIIFLNSISKEFFLILALLGLSASFNKKSKFVLIFPIFIIIITKPLYLPILVFWYFLRNRLYSRFFYTAVFLLACVALVEFNFGAILQVNTTLYYGDVSAISLRASGFEFAASLKRIMIYLGLPFLEIIKSTNFYSFILGFSSIATLLIAVSGAKPITMSKEGITSAAIPILLVSIFIPFLQLRYLAFFLCIAVIYIPKRGAICR